MLWVALIGIGSVPVAVLLAAAVSDTVDRDRQPTPTSYRRRGDHRETGQVGKCGKPDPPDIAEQSEVPGRHVPWDLSRGARNTLPKND